MNNRRSLPVGLDSVVETGKNTIYSECLKLWFPSEDAETTKKLNAFPRCYNIDKDGERIIGHYVKGKDYLPMIYAESNKFFFGEPYQVKEISGQINVFKAMIDLYFTLNLNEVKPDFIGRADGNVRAEVVSIIQRRVPDLKVVEVFQEIQDVYKGLAYKKTDNNHPNHCFRISLNAFTYKGDLPFCLT